MKAVLLVLFVAACTSKKPPAKPEQPQQGSAAPAPTDPKMDDSDASEGRAAPLPGHGSD